MTVVLPLSVETQFAHLPLLLNPDKSKLSKRHGDVAVEDFQVRGCLVCCTMTPRPCDASSMVCWLRRRG